MAEVVTAVVKVIAVILLLTYVEGDVTTTCESFPDNFRRFRRVFLDANGHTDIRLDIRMNIRTDGQALI